MLKLLKKTRINRDTSFKDFNSIFCHLIFRSEYRGFELEEVKKFETPYGARFEWTLLTDQKLIIHLKDKTKIRNRKRWSQVNEKIDVSLICIFRF